MHASFIDLRSTSSPSSEAQASAGLVDMSSALYTPCQGRPGKIETTRSDDLELTTATRGTSAPLLPLLSHVS